MDELSLFGPEPGIVPEKPAEHRRVRLRVLITVKAAPNPSERYGETVCVAGVRLDVEDLGSWVRLYPINFRELDDDSKFRKYDIVSLDATPSRDDPRPESWRPNIGTLKKEGRLIGWERRRPYAAHVTDSMCGMIAAVRNNPAARSLAAIRPQKVIGLDIEPHPGWTPDEQRKIDRYVSQLEFPGMSPAPRTALEAPRFKGWYRYLCEAPNCSSHRQGIYDWEWVALQRRLSDRDDMAAIAALRERFFGMICAPDRNLIFFVGNQAKRPEGFMVLGALYPRR